MRYRLACLNSGGDCAGLNTVNMETAKRTDVTYGDQAIFMGLREGQRAFAEYAKGNHDFIVYYGGNGIIGNGMHVFNNRDFIRRASSTNLGTQSSSSMKIYLKELAQEQNITYNEALKNYDALVIDGMGKMNLDGLFVTGGNGSMKNFQNLTRACARPPMIVGISKTIDNDNPGTDESVGFLSAVEEFVQDIFKCQNHAYSHKRCIVHKGFGRDTGHLSLYAGMAGGADIIIVPEYQWDIKEIIAKVKAKVAFKGYATMVVAEGATSKNADIEKFESATEYIVHRMNEQGIETRSQDTRYALRGCKPTASEILLASELSEESFKVMKAYLAASRKEQDAFPKLVMVGKTRNGRVTVYDLNKLQSGTKFVEDDDKMLNCALTKEVYVGTRDNNGNLIRNPACPQYKVNPAAIISPSEFFSRGR